MSNTQKDAIREFTLYEKRAHAGEAEGQTRLAICYSNGDGSLKDDAMAFFWMHAASLQGNIAAQTLLGGMYRDGLGTCRDVRQAYRWTERAAIAGHPIAQVDMSRACIERGDIKEALYWCELAADQGDQAALDLLDAYGA